MKRCKVGLRLLTDLLAVLVSIRSTVATTNCSSLSCAITAAIYPSAVTPTNRSTFCTSLVPQYSDCFATCPSDLFSTGISNYINWVCSQNDTACSTMLESYSLFPSCYNGTLAGIVDGISNSYNNKNATILYNNCQNLVWGTNCQLGLGNCSYLSQITTNSIQVNFSTTAAFYTCGAESGMFTFIETASCGQVLTTTLNSQCDVMCNISKATSISAVCQILQSQADCIMNASSGCSTIQSQYIVPRLTSYWAANEYLNCNIQIRNFTVGPRATTQCDFSSVLTACFNLSSNGSLESVKQLLTAQFDKSRICGLLNTPGVDPSMLVSQCVTAMVPCALPLGMVYNWPALNAPTSLYNSTTQYFPELGPFALNAWGLYSLINSLSLSSCTVSGNMVAQC